VLPMHFCKDSDRPATVYDQSRALGISPGHHTSGTRIESLLPMDETNRVASCAAGLKTHLARHNWPRISPPSLLAAKLTCDPAEGAGGAAIVFPPILRHAQSPRIRNGARIYGRHETLAANRARPEPIHHAFSPCQIPRKWRQVSAASPTATSLFHTDRLRSDAAVITRIDASTYGGNTLGFVLARLHVETSGRTTNTASQKPGARRANVSMIKLLAGAAGAGGRAVPFASWRPRHAGIA